MHDTRNKGILYLQKRGYRFSNSIAVSKLYKPEESWTKKRAWWFDLPIKKVREKRAKNYYLLGAKDGRKSRFVTLNVPKSFLLLHLKKKNFDIRYRKMIRLHLAAYKENWLVDERGKGRVDFSKFELK
jgi:hypothetical protein